MDKKIINFGKYRGKSLSEVAKIDPSYIFWLKECEIILVEDRIYDMAVDEVMNRHLQTEVSNKETKRKIFEDLKPYYRAFHTNYQ